MRKTRIRRHLDLKGDRATAWFSEHGWDVMTSGSRVLHVFIDELITGTVAVRRIWHTPVSLVRHRAPARKNSRSHLLILQADDRIKLSVETGPSVEISKYATAIVPTTSRATVSSSRPTARMEIDIVLPSEWTTRLEAGCRVEHRPLATWTIATSLINAVLNSSLEEGDAPFAGVSSSLESVALSIVAEMVPIGHHKGRRSDQLFDEALDAIRDNAHDPDFSIELLARKLSVSRRYLARVFAEHDSSPRGRLRDARLARARHLIASGVSGQQLDHVAELSGFPSARSLREAMRASARELQSSVQADTAPRIFASSHAQLAVSGPRMRLDSVR